MSFSPEEARAALGQARHAGARSATYRGYQSAGPHLMLWGAIYAVAYGAQYLRPGLGGLPWMVLAPAGAVGDWLIARADRPEAACAEPFLILLATFVGFTLASLAVLRPQDPRQIAAFIPLVVAASYVVLGVGIGRRLVWLGAGLGGLTLLGYYAVPGAFLLWMALVGGGGLILGGLWLRRI